jgi:hypothetical protein
MTTAAILVMFAGYATISYGYVLIRGYDITWNSWLSPVHPFQWPAGTVPLVPKGQVFP